MTLRLFTTSLLAATPLLGTLGCSKKENDPTLAPTPANTGSYSIDGRTVNATATAMQATRNGLHYLVVKLTTTPQPAYGPEVLYLELIKQPAEPVTAYHISSIDIVGYATSLIRYDDSTASLATTSSGGISCTFSGNAHFSSNTAIINSSVTKGVFTDVHY